MHDFKKYELTKAQNRLATAIRAREDAERALEAARRDEAVAYTKLKIVTEPFAYTTSVKTYQVAP